MTKGRLIGDSRPVPNKGNNWGEELLEEWLGIEDSNLGYLIQSQAFLPLD